jgi:NTP pyrophosphatase (non-canonical NTP hydrolase)
MSDNLQPTAYHPDEPEFEMPDDEGVIEQSAITQVEQLLRVAYSIGGSKNGEDLAEKVIEYMKQEVERELKKFDVTTTSVNTSSRVVESEVSELVELVEEKKTERIEEIESELDDVLSQLESREKNMTTRLLAKEETTNDGSCEIRTVKIVDKLFTTVTDKTLVFTGSIDGYTRSELKDQISDMGGRVTSSISSKTDYLVVGDEPGQNKQNDAKQYNVPTITGEEFLNIYNTIKDDTDEYGKEELNTLTPDEFNYSYPFKTFAVIMKRQPDDEEQIYPFIPWYGTMSCLCRDKNSVRQQTLCQHELYVLMKQAKDEFDPNGEITISERFKRLVNSKAYNEFMNKIMQPQTP